MARKAVVPRTARSSPVRIGTPEGAAAPTRGPVVPAHQRLREITLKGIVLGLLLSVLLGAANTYLGLKAGLTVAASIPAAVLSLAVLRLFARHTILENNMVQTIASAGTSVASGALFTIPALILLGRWTTIHYWETTAVVITGCLLGVLFTVPIRKTLIVEEKLPFPEGVATGEVLKAGDQGGAGVGVLMVGGALGAFYKLCQSGWRLWGEAAAGAARLGDRAVIGFGANLSPALMGVGLIVGLRIAILVFGGGVLGWFVGIPLYSQFAPDFLELRAIAFSDGGTYDALPALVWSRRIRYIGVGAMLVGGLWSLVKLRRPLTRAIRQGIQGARGGTDAPVALRTERDLSFKIVGVGILLVVVPITIFYALFTGNWVVAVAMAVIMVATGFMFSAVGAYMAGLVGSSNTPISGVTILTLIVSAFTLLLFGIGVGVGPAAAVFVAAIIAVAGSIASDNLQDLKAGHIVGATPWKQELLLMIGGVASAFAIAPVMNILIEGAGGAAALGSDSLPAPQANLMASVSRAIFEGGLPYAMVFVGMGLAVVLIVLDGILARSGSTFRTPVMPVAVGIYLPVGLSVPIFLGGLASFFVERYYGIQTTAAGVLQTIRQRLADVGGRNGILYGSGLIAGEALMGIFTSVLFIFYDRYGNSWANWRLVSSATEEWAAWAGAILLLFLVYLAYYVSVRPALRPSESQG